jgi:hypothetical protein
MRNERDEIVAIDFFISTILLFSWPLIHYLIDYSILVAIDLLSNKLFYYFINYFILVAIDLLSH